MGLLDTSTSIPPADTAQLGAGQTISTEASKLDALRQLKEEQTKKLQDEFRLLVPARLQGRLTETGLRADEGISKRADEIWKAFKHPEHLSNEQLQSLISDANAIGFLVDQVTGIKTGGAPLNPKPEFVFSPERIAGVRKRYVAGLNEEYRQAVKENAIGKIGILHLDDNPERAKIISELISPYLEHKTLSPEQAKRFIEDLHKLGEMAAFLNHRGASNEYVPPEKALTTDGLDPAGAERRRRDYFLSKASLSRDDIKKAQSWEYLPVGTTEITLQDAIRLGTPPKVQKFADLITDRAIHHRTEGKCLGRVNDCLEACGLKSARVGRALRSAPVFRQFYVTITGVTKDNAHLLPDGVMLIMRSTNGSTGHIEVVKHLEDKGKTVGVADHFSPAPAAYCTGNLVAIMPQKIKRA